MYSANNQHNIKSRRFQSFFCGDGSGGGDDDGGKFIRLTSSDCRIFHHHRSHHPKVPLSSAAVAALCVLSLSFSVAGNFVPGNCAIVGSSSSGVQLHTGIYF